MTKGTKKLTRSRNDRWLAGVCGGIAEYLEVDSTLIRVLFILFGFAVGGGILIYIILWLIIPEAPEGAGSGLDLSASPVEKEPPAEPPEESEEANDQSMN